MFYLYPLPPEGFDYASVNLPADWPHLSGIAAHWDKNTNVAADFDRWFMNKFPRESPFVASPGGYQTLNFIPALATMIFGLLAGELLQSGQAAWRKFGWLVLAGAACVGAGWALDHWGSLSDRQTHLDAQLDPLQHRLGAADAGQFLCRGRHPRLSPLDVPIRRRRHELDSYLRDGRAAARVVHAAGCTRIWGPRFLRCGASCRPFTRRWLPASFCLRSCG